MLAAAMETWDDMRSSWWFLPLTMSIGAILLSFATTSLDAALGDQVARRFPLYAGGAEGSRSVLETVAGSMITVAGVTFSIAIVVMTLVSSQFGPRVLRSFMRDLGNQLTLGTFVATFLFSLLTLRAVRSQTEAEFAAHLSVTVAMLLTLASIGVFIYFIHHAARSSQVAHIISAVGHDLDHGVDHVFPSALGKDAPGDAGPVERDRDDGATLVSRRSGYLQLISGRALMGAAGDADVLVELLVQPGSYVAEGTELARVWPRDRLDDKLSERIRGALVLGSQRTEQQDVGYALEQLQQICLRALSPALNDPLTAHMCIDRLAAGLARFAQREIPSAMRVDDEGSVRVLTQAPSLAALLDVGLAEVRRSARTNVSATLRLLRGLAVIGAQASRREDIATLREIATLIGQEMADELTDDDRRVIREAQQEAFAAMRQHEDSPPPIAR